MLLTPERTLCEKNQSVIVSKDKGSQVQHRAINPERIYEMRHYKLDCDLVKQEKCCDFLLVNDTKRKAYFIELKGGNIDEAVLQLEAGEKKCKDELSGYTFLFRIVCSKAKTHNIKSNNFRKFKEKCGTRLKHKEAVLEETLD